MRPSGAAQAVGIVERGEGGDATSPKRPRRSGERAAQTNVGRRLGGALAQRGAREV